VCIRVPFAATSSGTFVVSFLNDCHSDWDEIESQCHFDLHFLYN
jgi:hypothetical protein